MFKPFSFKSATLYTATIALLTACGIGGTPIRDEVAARIAAPAWMIERQINVPPFNLTAFERMHEREQPATLYIEGDGMANRLAETIFYAAAPEHPVALHLASRDKSTNLAYLARPCQYSGLSDPEEDCTAEKWKTFKAYGPETLNAYNTALNKMKRRYGLTGFHIVGHDSGATLAALLAAARADTLSLRTVAGEFDIDALQPHKVALKGIPQHHFAGGQDTKNKPVEIHSYLQMLGESECTETTFIQEAAHYSGWVDKWPELLKKKLPRCIAPMAPEFTPIETPEPIFYPRMDGSKK